jgi:hypothetical protein
MLALLFPALLCQALAGQLSTDGLREGESLIQLAPSPRKSEATTPAREFRHGQVLDAFTGKPVAGARIETWTEEIDGHFGGQHRIGVATSAIDGRYVARVQSGLVQAEKIRVSAPGYLTFSGTAGDIYDTLRLFPAEEHPPRLRITDLEGRPIAGARITSTYTCAHDVPALDVTTGADGIAILRGYGLQRDIQDLRVRAVGFAPIKYLDGEPSFDRVAQGSPFTVRLRRAQPFALKLLDREGERLSHAPAYLLEGDFYHVLRSDKQGIVRVAYRHGWRGVNVQRLAGKSPEWFGEIVPTGGRVPALRPHAEDWPKKTPVGRLIVEPQGAALPEELDVYAFSETGWMRDYDDWHEPVVFPAGPGFLVIGAPFSGVKQQVIDFELPRAQDLTLRPRYVPEPQVTFALKDPEGYGLTVQVGKHSREDFPFNKALPIPGARPVEVYLQGHGRGVYARLQPAGDSMRFDLDALLAQPPSSSKKPAGEPELAKQQLRLIDSSTGKPLRAKAGLTHGPGCRLRSVAPDRFEIEGPIGRAWLAELESKGGPTVWARGRIGTGKAEHTVARAPWASLELSTDLEIEGGDELDLEQLCPGPLQLVLGDRAGRRYGLSLQLRPGETRKIRIGR